MTRLRIGIVDSGVNPWHSHVRGQVAGCRIFVAPDGGIQEDGDFRDSSGHGTAVAGVVREAFPDAEIFAVRVFDADEDTYPSLVARGILRAAAPRRYRASIPSPPMTRLSPATSAIADR